MRHVRASLLLATTLALSASIFALDSVTKIDDEKVLGVVTRIDSAKTVDVLAGGAAARTVRIPADEVLSVRMGTEAPATSLDKSDILVLASGERYRVKLEQPVKAELVCTGALPLAGTNTVAFGDVHAWVPWQPEVPVEAAPDVEEPEGAEDDAPAPEVEIPPTPEEVLKRLLALENDRDVLLMTNDDRVTGVIESVGPEGAVVSSRLGKVTVKRDLIRGIAFSKTLKPYRDPEGVLAEVTLSGGATVLGAITGPEDGTYALRSVLGPAWRVEAGAVRKVSFRGGRLVWLSDLKPSETEVTPFFNRSWPPRVNLSVWGGPLTVAGETYERGLGLHSKTELTWHLDGRFTSFVTLIGIDDETHDTGSALVSVVADGRTLLKPIPVKGGDKPKTVKLDVAGVREMKLLVDYGEGQDFGDHVDLLDARLLKK